jgi:hypothetical protein
VVIEATIGDIAGLIPTSRATAHRTMWATIYDGLVRPTRI